MVYKESPCAWEVTRATLIAQITYASPSWGGFIKCDELTRLKTIVSKASRYGYLPANFPSLERLLESSDESLFTATRHNPQHYVLHNCFLFPKLLVITYVCADMGLHYPTCNLGICEKNFLNHGYKVFLSYNHVLNRSLCCTETFINVFISCLFA